jgi:hypothetical protein
MTLVETELAIMILMGVIGLILKIYQLGNEAFKV